MSLPEELPWSREAARVRQQPAGRGTFSIPGRLSLTQLPWLRRLIESRWPLFLARLLTLSGFAFTLAAGLFGTRVGSHNFAIIFVWIAWWTALKLSFIPLGGRSWCSICPIPMPGEWLQQGGVLGPGSGRLGLNMRWPRRLKGSWLQSGSFVLVGLFSAVTLTDPRVTAWVSLALLGLATGLALVFERRAFCNYVCPIGGFTGLYAKTAPLEVRVVDTALCATHSEKTCYQACPWGLYPVALRDSAACGLCMECLRACPRDNISINLRPFGSDLGPGRITDRLDETALALVMLGSALAFAAVFTGPWGVLKSAAYAIGSIGWWVYALGFLALNLGILPGLFTLAAWTSRRLSGSQVAMKRWIAAHSQVLLPLGLSAWMAFTVSFAFPKLPYVLQVLSDPFGWGWNLLGTAGRPVSLDVSGFSMPLQAALLLCGLLWSARVARRLATDEGAMRQVLPSLAFCLLFVIAMLWLLIG